jgi:hypothetical protein
LNVRVKTFLKFLVASEILATLSIYTASSLSSIFWLLFLIVFTFSILIFTRLSEMWTVIPTFIAGKMWIYILGPTFNGYAISILALSFIFLFFSELKRGSSQKIKGTKSRLPIS